TGRDWPPDRHRTGGSRGRCDRLQAWPPVRRLAGSRPPATSDRGEDDAAGADEARESLPLPPPHPRCPCGATGRRSQDGSPASLAPRGQGPAPETLCQRGQRTRRPGSAGRYERRGTAIVPPRNVGGMSRLGAQERDITDMGSHQTIAWAVTEGWQDRSDRLFQTLGLAETIKGRQTVEERGAESIQAGRHTCPPCNRPYICVQS